MTGRPWMKWYPGDWRADPLLRACDPISRYVWMEMIGLMHEAEPYGHLVIAGRAMDYKTLSRVIGVTEGDVKRAAKELESLGVFSRTNSGVIFSRRMIRDEKRRETLQKNGTKGGNPALKNQELSSGLDNQEDNPPLKTQRPEAREKTKVTTLAKSLLPDDWQPKPFGIEAESRKIVDSWSPAEFKRQVESFKAHHRGNGNRWKDWQDAWQTWVLNSVKFGRPRQSAEPTSYLDHLIEARAAGAAA